jgi:hypothetical protein
LYNWILQLNGFDLGSVVKAIDPWLAHNKAQEKARRQNDRNPAGNAGTVFVMVWINVSFLKK